MIDDGIDGESGRTVDLQFSGDVSPVGDDRIDRDAEMVGDLLVGHALNEADHHVLFAFAQRISVFPALADHARDLGRHVVLLHLLLQPPDGGDEDRLLDLSML